MRKFIVPDMGCTATIQCWCEDFSNPPPPINTGSGGGILESLCPSVVPSMCLIVSAQYLLNSSTFFSFFFTKLGMVVHYHDAMYHAENLVHYLQCQGYSVGLYNQNMTISTISSKVLLHLQPDLV